MARLPPRSPLFPYTTLFRSHSSIVAKHGCKADVPHAAFAGLGWQFALHNPVLDGMAFGCGLQYLQQAADGDRKSTRLNSSHPSISYAVFCLRKKNIDGTLTA